jgi:predicted RNase H-like nuclease
MTRADVETLKTQTAPFVNRGTWYRFEVFPTPLIHALFKCLEYTVKYSFRIGQTQFSLCDVIKEVSTMESSNVPGQRFPRPNIKMVKYAIQHCR